MKELDEAITLHRIKELAQEAEPWPEPERTRMSRGAWSEYFSHSYRHARRDPDNCSACALQVQPVPNYSGWLRVYIQGGIPANRKAALAEIVRASTENVAYYAAILRDIRTFQPSWVK